MFFEDLLADLPAPRDDEPPSLRNDIADELADHLHCALRRELLKDGDAVAAEERVIDRFGNPKKLARRLWWQAMWSRIMGQRILSGLQWLLTLAAVVLAGLVFRQQSELITEIRTARETDAKNYQVISEVMQRLQQQSGPSAHQEVGQYEPGDSAQGSAGPTYFQPENADGRSSYPGKSEGEQRETASNVSLLTIKLVQESEDGPPVTALELALEGRHGRVAATGPLSEPVTVTRMVDGKEISEVVARATGAYLFQVQEPGRYQLNTYLSDGQFSEQSVLIRPNEKREMTVICPKPREQVLVALTAPPLPQELQSLQCELEIVLNDQSTTLNGVEWNATSPNCQRVKFDPQGGPVVEIQNQANGETINLRRSKPEERAVVLLSGPVQYNFHLAPRRDGATNVAVWPGQGELLTKVIVPGENHWELELAEELLTEAKKLFVHDDSPVTATETSDSMAVHDEPAVLSVKLVQGKEDGPPVLGAMAALRWGQFYSEQREETRPFQPRYSEDGIPFAEVFQPVKGNVFRFPGLKPDRYSLEITLLDGQVCKQQVLIRDDQPKELTVICPAAREKAPVLITAPLLPDDLREAKYKLWCRVTAAPLGLGAVAWKAANAEANTSIVIFDAATGKPQEIDGTPFDPTTSEDDRVVFLMTGPNRARIKLYRDGDAITLIETDWPKVRGDEVLQTVKPGENRWEMELSDEMLAAARKRLAENSPAEDSFDESAGARTETATGKLSVVLHQQSPAMWEMFRSVKSLDSSRLVVTNHRTKRAAQPSSFFLNQDQANRSTARFEFDRLESGGSVLKVELPDGQMLNQNVVVSEETPQQIELDAPRERYRLPVLLSIPPLPDDLKQANWRLSVQLTELPLVKNELEWSLKDPYVYRMGFNTDGSPSYLVRPHLGTLQYGQSPQADNPAVLALGPVRCRFQLRVNNTDVGNGMIEQPLEDAEIRTVEAKVQDGGLDLERIEWRFELPEKFLAVARMRATPDNANSKPEAASGNSPGTKTETAREPLADQCRLIVKLTSETADGPAAKGAMLELRDDAGEFAWVRHENVATAQTSLRLGPDGKCVMGPMDPGRYTLDVRFADGRHAEIKLPLLRPGQERTEQIICPPETKKAVVNLAVTPVPGELQNSDRLLTATLGLKRFEIGGVTWERPDSMRTIVFDQKTGLPSALVDSEGRQATDLSRVPVDDRGLIVPSGDYEISFAWRSIDPRNGLFHKTMADWPQAATTKLKPGENEWKIDLSEQFSKLGE